MKRKANFSDIVKLDGWKMSDVKYRAMLDHINPRCYVESQSTSQWGEVDKVIRNKQGVPVCVRVTGADDRGNFVDYISVDRIDFFEPYDCYTSDINEYNVEAEQEYINSLLRSGYIWDDDKCCYYNAETGDEVIW
jgi:hypothetical protein